MSKLYLMAIDKEHQDGQPLPVAKVLRTVLSIPLEEAGNIYKRVVAEGPQVLKEDERHVLSDDQWQLARNQALRLRIDPSEDVLAAAVPEVGETAPDAETYSTRAVHTALVLQGAMGGDVLDAAGLAEFLRKSTADDDLYREVITILANSYSMRVERG
jgi:3-oxoacyl-ACP reductase-like protein